MCFVISVRLNEETSITFSIALSFSPYISMIWAKAPIQTGKLFPLPKGSGY